MFESINQTNRPNKTGLKQTDKKRSEKTKRKYNLHNIPLNNNNTLEENTLKIKPRQCPA